MPYEPSWHHKVKPESYVEVAPETTSGSLFVKVRILLLITSPLYKTIALIRSSTTFGAGFKIKLKLFSVVGPVSIVLVSGFSIGEVLSQYTPLYSSADGLPNLYLYHLIS